MHTLFNVRSLGLLVTSLISLSVFAGPGDGLIHWSTTDKHADITLSTDQLGVEVTGTGYKGVRSNFPITPGEGFYYFEAKDLSVAGDFGFGIATASASLDGAGGQDQQSLVITGGAVYFGGDWLFGVPGTPSTFGIAVDYRGDFPIVHFIASSADGEPVEFLTTVQLDVIHEPVYIYMYASDTGAGEQQRINLGASPFVYDPVIGLEQVYFNGGGRSGIGLAATR